MNLLKSLNNSLSASICLVLGWGGATLLHECCHAGVALVFGHAVSFGEITLTTGSVFVHGEMSSLATVCVAAGSIGLVVAGLFHVVDINNKL